MSHCPLKEAARDTPDFPALVSAEKSFSFSELDALVEAQVGELQALGIQSGDRIAVCQLPKMQLIALLFAAWRIGASICPLNPRFPPLLIQQIRDRLQPRLFFDTKQLFASTPSPHSLFLLTSGSTGIPKIAMLSLDNLIQNALFSLAALDFQPQDRWLLSLPLYHVGGIGILFRAILGRGTIALDDKDLKITHLSNVPTQLYRAWPIYPRLKCLLLGGGPIHNIPAQLPIVISYGLTEMASIVGAGNPSLRLLPQRELRIDGRGEIWVRGKCLFQGYWGEPVQGWFPTGDLGRWDKEGFSILGRKDWMFISGGENIQPEEIEMHLLEIPGVLEAVVVPKSDPEFGKRPIAVLAATCTERQIRSFLAEKLPKYKIPTAFYFVEEIPKMGLKIDRRIVAKNFT